MMQDNLARQMENHVNHMNQPQPRHEPEKIHIPQPIKKGYTKLEAAVISFFGLVLFGLAVAHIALTMQVSTVNRTIQDLESQAVVTQIEIENHEQKVQELSRYDRVYTIARQHELEMNEEQIRNVFR
ncbi:MAG: cell division protein FtsL [Alkalibacterium sp.]|nr:cell division protein FtsL [Alkalibacterium sp.]